MPTREEPQGRPVPPDYDSGVTPFVMPERARTFFVSRSRAQLRKGRGVLDEAVARALALGLTSRQVRTLLAGAAERLALAEKRR